MAITQRCVLWLIPFALLDGILAGLRWPQTYALSHMMIDYHYEFGKRGLIGALLHLVDHPPYHYLTLALIAFLVTGLWLLALLWLGRRVMREDMGIAAAFLLFFLSAGFASLIRDVGRGEHFGLLLALACLAMPATWPWLAARTLLLISAMLMHEGNFLIVVPLVAFDILVTGQSAWSRRALRAACTILPVAVVTFYLGNNMRDCNVAQVTAFYQKWAADFTFLPIPVATLCLNGNANLHAAANDLWLVHRRAILFPLTMFVVLPSTVLNVWLLRRVLAGRILDFAAGVAASLAPLFLLAIAVDLVRFATLIQATSLIVLVAASRRVDLPQAGTFASRMPSLALVGALAAFELWISLPLNDGNNVLKFPFVPLLQHVDDVLHGRAPFVVIPTY